MISEIDHDPGHVPVLLEEAMQFLAPAKAGVYCDATLGLGGHSAAILRPPMAG
jgi:16S rRNA (cytosine1402-N4)-methyltransferase